MTIKGNYGSSASGNFKVVDTIGVPHPYCITPRHVEVAADYHGGILDESAIEDAERRGAACDTCTHISRRDGSKPVLSYAEHETALLVGCNAELKGDDGKVNPELNAYLLTIVDEATKNGYAGFAFKRGM